MKKVLAALVKAAKGLLDVGAYGLLALATFLTMVKLAEESTLAFAIILAALILMAGMFAMALAIYKRPAPPERYWILKGGMSVEIQDSDLLAHEAKKDLKNMIAEFNARQQKAKEGEDKA